MHSGGFELTKLTYNMLEDNPIRHRGATGTTLDITMYWAHTAGAQRKAHTTRTYAPGTWYQETQGNTHLAI